MAPVRIPRKRFKQVINDYESVPLEYAEENPSEESFEDDIEMRLTFDSFFSALSEMDKRIVAMKRKGIGEKEMAEELGCSMFTQHHLPAVCAGDVAHEIASRFLF